MNELASSGGPPPSVVMYAFRDRLGAGDDFALACQLVGVAAWALREQGTIDLAPLPHPRPVDGRLGFNRKRGYADQPGLEGHLLFSMTGRGKTTPGISMWALFTIGLPVGWETEARHDGLRHAIETAQWRTRNPARTVLALCRREGRKVGVLSRFGGGVRGDAASGLELAFAGVDAGWRAFAEREAQLYAGLMDDCAQGLRAGR
jgi:hypothetical protein